MPDTPISPAAALPRITACLEAGGSCPLVVTGTSMRPFLRHRRDTVLLAPVTGPIRRGDILFYLRAPGVCVLHRVCQVEPDGTLLLCGDAQTALEPVRREQVLARVTHVRRGERTVSVDALPLRLAVGLWMALRPVRPLLKKFGLLR